MLSGDFATFPLSDLLQWIDHSRRSGVLEIDMGQGDRAQPFWVQFAERRIVAAARPPRSAALGELARWTPPRPEEGLWPEACVDRLLDVFLDPGRGRFSFADGAASFEEGVPLDVPIGGVTLEGLRRLDEWPLLDRAYPADSAVLRADRDGQAPTPGLEAVLAAARAGATLAEARLALLLSRAALLRRVEALRERGLARAEGAGMRQDPITSLVEQARRLVSERQFDEAALVFRTLLAADPADRRVRLLLQEAEREQVAALYEELSPVAVPVLATEGALDSATGRRLLATDRDVAGRINGRWDVASIALASPLREVETLKALRKLRRLGVIDLREPPGGG